MIRGLKQLRRYLQDAKDFQTNALQICCDEGNPLSFFVMLKFGNFCCKTGGII
jgi:hypothetical protein